MSTTLSQHCKCGAAIAVPFFAYPLIHSFTQLHLQCVTQTGGDELQEPGGDVYASAERGGQHSRHELQIGFQRGDDLSW